jgi:isopentenyl phosphate kinase
LWLSAQSGANVIKQIFVSITATLMPKLPVVIKVGGAALTDKSKICTPRMPVIDKVASQIATIGRKVPVILVHGAGSFGHISVKQYGLARGFKSRSQLKGLALTRSKLLEWELILDKTLLKHGVPLMPFRTSDFVVARKGRIVSAELRPIQECLSLGCVPLSGGDIVMDLRARFSVVSGDQLAAYLAIKFHASGLIFGVDVDGVFDTNPRVYRKAKLLEKLTLHQASQIVSKATAHTGTDVTGGMAGKVMEAVVAARRGIPVCFVNLTKDERLVKAALNRPVLGTRIPSQ